MVLGVYFILPRLCVGLQSGSGLQALNPNPQRRVLSQPESLSHEPLHPEIFLGLNLEITPGGVG